MKKLSPEEAYRIATSGNGTPDVAYTDRKTLRLMLKGLGWSKRKIANYMRKLAATQTVQS